MIAPQALLRQLPYQVGLVQSRVCSHLQQLRNLHASTVTPAETGSSPSDADPAAAEAAAAAAAAAAAGASGRLPHISLEHPDVNRYLRYNTEFKTDELRVHKIGMVQAVKKSRDACLRQMLAAHRLEQRDAQLAARHAAAPLQDQMAERLAQMEAAVRAGGI